MRINIYTNTQKSQFRNVKEGIWQILGIPITVDDAVMNGILYEKEENAKGLASYRDKPVTLRHPEDENGNGTSAASGRAMMDHFSGGVIINTYNHNGINYVDAEFKEKMLLAQDNGEYYVNRLKQELPIGISTGLWFDDNEESGINGCGKKYYKKAKNQIGDHVAMLPDEELPAGGDATFIRFNGENNNQILSVSIDELIEELGGVDEAINGIATNEEEKSLLKQLLAFCKRTFATDKQSGDNSKGKLTTNEEGDAMRETLEKALKAKGISFNAEDTEAELLGKLTAQPEVDLTATNSAIASLTETVTALQTQLTANADKELDALAKQAAPFMGVDEAEAKALGANALHKVLAKNGVTVGAPNATNYQPPKANGDDFTINMSPWEDK
jgi:hypothetical protein